MVASWPIDRRSCPFVGAGITVCAEKWEKEVIPQTLMRRWLHILLVYVRRMSPVRTQPPYSNVEEFRCLGFPSTGVEIWNSRYGLCLSWGNIFTNETNLPSQPIPLSTTRAQESIKKNERLHARIFIYLLFFPPLFLLWLLVEVNGFAINVAWLQSWQRLVTRHVARAWDPIRNLQ